jgi:hypothetical protein
MIKRALLLFFMALGIDVSAQRVIYYTPVEMPVALQHDYYYTMQPKVLAEDAAFLLSTATGKTWIAQPENGDSKGIHLRLNPANNYGNEAARVITNGQSVQIESTFITGLSYGLYTYLHHLGFRFYMPGNNWIYYPDEIDLYSTPVDTIYKPEFKLRMFGASGGLFAVKGLDPEQQFRNDWYTFYRRNRMGCDYIRIDGHSGEKFNLAYKEIIEKDPKILAPIDGKQRFSIAGKIDPTYAKGVELFSKWIAERYVKESVAWPDFLPFKKYASVDPGDGLNYCKTEACKKTFPGIPDQMYFIARNALLELNKVQPNASVSTMAYSERSDTPVAPIPEAIHTMVVPGAFQTVSTPAELMQRWSIKTKNFSQYEFLNIGVWAYDQPFFNIHQYAHHIRFLKNIGAQGMSVESTQSAFAAGLPTWFILNLYANTQIDTKEELKRISAQMFGKASVHLLPVLELFYASNTHIKTMQDRPAFDADELGFIVQKITDASKMNGLTAAVQQRILELKAYTVYLCKHYELFHDIQIKYLAEQKNFRTETYAENLLHYIWKTYDYRIIHCTQMNDLLKKLVKEPEKWDFKKSDYGCFKGNHIKTILTAFDTLAQKYPYTVMDFLSKDSFPDAIMNLTADSLRICTQDEDAFKNFMYGLPLYAPAAGKIRIQFKATATTAAENETQLFGLIGLESEDYSVMTHHFIRQTPDEGIIELNVPGKGHYTLYIGQFQSTHIEMTIYPGKALFYLHKKSIPKNGIVLQDTPGSAYDNAYLTVMEPQHTKPAVRLSHIGSKMTAAFYNGNGETLKTDEANDQGVYRINTSNKTSNGLIYFTNSVNRWPPLFYYSAPYIFFLKKPVKQTD